MGYSAFSTNYEGRNPFSPKYKGRNNGFSRTAHQNKAKNQYVLLYSTDKQIYTEIQKKNAELFKSIKMNFEAYNKTPDRKTKSKAFTLCKEKAKQMYLNIKGKNIDLDEVYFDERNHIVKNIKEANEIVEKLK